MPRITSTKRWRRWKDQHPKSHLLNRAKLRAKKRGIPFALTVNDIEWPTHCPVLGFELDYNKTPSGSRWRLENIPSLDRRDNSLGYVPGNVFVISYRANTLKRDASLIEIKALLAYMAV